MQGSNVLSSDVDRQTYSPDLSASPRLCESNSGSSLAETQSRRELNATKWISKNLPSQYDHAAAQAKWYPEWEERGYFHAERADDRAKPPFTIVIPPPNVTGALHLGHALNNTLQDILIRMKRMQGFNTLWMPGTDHAGIATQAVVERRLFEEEKKTRHDLGREGLVDRIWKWKDQYEARILGAAEAARLQLRLGSGRSSRSTSTMSRAVRESFFRLFKDGKIYRGKRLVNWDTFLQTAVSDDEVFHEPMKGHFWHFKYPVIDPKPGEPTHVTIATTRPETMLGDTAVAVHPDPADGVRQGRAPSCARSCSPRPPRRRPSIEAADRRCCSTAARRCCRSSSSCATWPSAA